MTRAFSPKITSMAPTSSHRRGIDLCLLARPEIQKVMAEINSMAPGQGQILAIHGDRSIGKSSLARSILRNLSGWSAYSMSATSGMDTADLINRINLVLTESESENAHGEVNSAPQASQVPQAAEDINSALDSMVHIVDVPFSSTLIHIDD